MPRLRSPSVRLPPAALRALALLLLALSPGCATTGQPDAEVAGAVRPPVTVLRALPDLGIVVTALRLTAAETMLDFRYRVTDSRRAAQLLRRQTQPYAIDALTGTKLGVPRAAKIGPLRQTAVEAREGKVYFVFFGNAGRVVRRGGHVTIVFGDVRIENLPVE